LRKLTHYELRVLIKNELNLLRESDNNDILYIQGRCEDIVKYCNEYNGLDEPVYPTPKVTSEHINDAQDYLRTNRRQSHCKNCNAKLNWAENLGAQTYASRCCGILYEISA
jgi:hypothetical protein